MIGRRICYLLLLAAGGYFMMLYNFQGLRFLLCCGVSIPLLSAFCLLPGRFRCRASLEAEQSAVTRGETATFTVRIKNRSLLPVSRLYVELCWRAPGEKTVKEKRWFYGLGMNGEERFSVELSPRHCGVASLAVRKAVIYDFLGLIGMPVGGRKTARVCVSPVIEPISPRLREIYLLIAAGMGTEREGDLLLRDFQAGDSLHRIYWKLAARSGDLQVRDFECSGTVRVLLDFTEEFAAQAQGWDRYLDKACSLLYFFAEEGRNQIFVEVLWRRAGGWLKAELTDGEAVRAWVEGLLWGRPSGILLGGEENAAAGNCLRLEEDGRLYFGEQCVYEE